MATHTRDPIICECGHEGFLHCKENDQPYSRMWEDYDLEGFEGGAITIDGTSKRPADMLVHLNPKCPQCGQTGKVKYKNA
jgi:hypothetical protein